ncbi:DUF3829 domain-containing protein [Flavobacterium sp. '19STA2R22 D10 B1']|uniref:DUF3829 domain-containing protein n=1 Tax=Flavobacterium aerium TaxID=3037261 RepID=UPI00278C4B1A|nr:DUF3829 domain-containing protein [Flavobacterium sp. '19STA2R22 D10 B1']
MKRILFFALTSLFLFSCNSKTENKNTDSETKNETSDNPLMSDDGIDKFNAYIDFFNQKNSIYTNLDGYLKSVDKTGAPVDKERGLYISQLHPYVVQKISEKVDAAPSFEKLDKTTKELIKTYEALQVNVNKLYEYNAIKEFLSDDYAKAKELYPLILADYKKFEELDLIIEEETIVYQNKVRDAELEHFKKMGYDISYAKTMFINSSRDFLDYVSTEDIYGINKMDPEKVKTMANKVSADFSAFTEKAGDKKLVEKEFGNTSYRIDSFKSNAQSYVSQCRSLQQLLSDPKKLKAAIETHEFHRGLIVPDGTPAKILEAFNSMISSSNNMM